jgi:hypothetical protein
VSDVSESFKVDFLACQRILVIIVFTKDFDLFELSAGQFHFNELAFSFGFDHLTLNLERVSQFSLFDLFPVGYGVLNDNLEWS